VLVIFWNGFQQAIHFQAKMLNKYDVDDGVILFVVESPEQAMIWKLQQPRSKFECGYSLIDLFLFQYQNLIGIIFFSLHWFTYSFLLSQIHLILSTCYFKTQEQKINLKIIRTRILFTFPQRIWFAFSLSLMQTYVNLNVFFIFIQRLAEVMRC